MNRMQTLLSGAGALGVPLSEDAASRLLCFMDEVLRKNEVMNLTAITDEGEFITRHLLDSLTLLTTGLVKEGNTLIDVGCGAGFPSMPLQLALPGLSCTLLDSLQKRVRFLEEAGRLCGAKNAHYLAARAEEAARRPEYREHFDLATARGVASLSRLCEYCLPFVKVGGHFLAMKGEDPTNEVNEARNAIGSLGGRLEEVRGVTLPTDGLKHTIIVIRKASKTDAKYPRTQAKIVKNPL